MGRVHRKSRKLRTRTKKLKNDLLKLYFISSSRATLMKLIAKSLSCISCLMFLRNFYLNLSYLKCSISFQMKWTIGLLTLIKLVAGGKHKNKTLTTNRPPITEDYDDLYELDLDDMTNFNITENTSIQ